MSAHRKKSRATRVKKIMRDVKEAKQFLAVMTYERVDELLRIGEETAEPDGYPSGGDELGVRSTSGTSSVEQAALNTHVPRDFIGQLVNETIPGYLAEIRQVAARAHKAVDAVEHRGDARFGREDSLGGSCQICGYETMGTEQDRLRAGYCFKHYQRWMKAGKPERYAFEHQQRLVDLEEEQEVLPEKAA